MDHSMLQLQSSSPRFHTLDYAPHQAVTLLNWTFNPVEQSTYDWSNAVDDYRTWGVSPAHNNSIALYSFGCQKDLNNPFGQPDCLTACQNTTLVWNTPFSAYTIHNCIVYPIIAQLWHDGNLTQESIEVAEYFGIKNTTNSPLYTTVPVINDCFHDYCVNFEAEEESEWCHTNGTFDIGLKNWTLAFPTDICHDLEAAVNSDLMGIGVAISLIMQISILTLAWVLFHFCWDFISFVTYFHRRRTGGQPSALQEKLRNSKAAKALIEWEGLFEFQKTQVWLMIAIQIACLIALKHPEFFEASTWQQYRNNIGVIYDISFGGILPVLLSLILLRHAEKIEWLQLLTSTICVSLASAVWLLDRHLNTFDYFQPDAITHEGPASCAKLAPTALCFPQDWFSHSSAAGTKRGVGEIIFCWIVLFYLVVENLRIFKEKEGRVDGRKRNIWEVSKSSLAQKGRAYQNRHAKVGEDGRPVGPGKSAVLYSNRFWKRTSQVIILLAEVVLLALSLRLFKDYYRIFNSKSEKGFTVIDTSHWTLGQIIAMTAFLPPIIMFFWHCIFGVEEEKEQGEGSEKTIGRSTSNASSSWTDETMVTQLRKGSSAVM